jgi:hypothetical protein
MQISKRIGRRRLLTRAGLVCYALYLAWTSVDWEDCVEQSLLTYDENPEARSTLERKIDMHRLSKDETRASMLERSRKTDEQVLLIMTKSKPVTYPNLRSFTPNSQRSTD